VALDLQEPPYLAYAIERRRALGTTTAHGRAAASRRLLALSSVATSAIGLAGRRGQTSIEAGRDSLVLARADLDGTARRRKRLHCRLNGDLSRNLASGQARVSPRAVSALVLWDHASERTLLVDANTTLIDIDDVKSVVVETLGIEDRADALDETTPLLGSLPELDSMAVLALVLALEERFGITIDGEDITAEIFETLASLTDFVEGNFR
jgi:acyl carrier protein